MIERKPKRSRKNKILRTRQHPAGPAIRHKRLDSTRPGTKKAGTSKSNANTYPSPERRALGSLSKSYGFKTKSLTRMSSYAMAGRNGQFLARCKSVTTLSRATCPARHSTICTRNISKLTSEKFGKYRPLFLYIGRFTLSAQHCIAPRIVKHS